METPLHHSNGLTSATPIRLYAAFLNSTFCSTGRPAMTFTDDEARASIGVWRRIRSRTRPPRSWRSCRCITSWTLTRRCRRQWRPICPRPWRVAGCRWLTENDIDVYVTEYERTGFQGALQWYRVQVGRPDLADLQLFTGRRIDVPSMFIAGCSDWAVYLISGAFERSAVCTRMEDCRFVKDAGHWLQQQQPEAVTDLLVDFLRR